MRRSSSLILRYSFSLNCGSSTAYYKKSYKFVTLPTNFAEKILRVDRIRSKPDYLQPQTQAPTNIQLLCEAEIDTLQQLHKQHTTDWLFASERKQRLSERSLHHIIQQAGAIANLPFPTHPHMLRRAGLYYRAALLLEPLGLTLRQCCLLWNWNGTTVEFSPQEEQDYRAIDRATVTAFKAALEKLKAFAGIAVYQNVIDYLLGAFLLFPCLQGIPQDYWLAPRDWQI